MTVDLGPQRLTGAAALDDIVATADNFLPLDTSNWSTNASDYPMMIEVGGEICSASGFTESGGKITLTGVARSLNGVIKGHLPGADVSPAHKFLLGLSSRAVDRLLTTTPTVGVDFWEIWDAIVNAPARTLEALGHPTPGTPISRAELDAVLDNWVAGTGGTTRNVTSEAGFATVVAAAVPGDLIRITQNLTLTADLVVRGNKYGLGSVTLTTSPAGGTATLPIIITCANGVTVNRNDQGNNSSCLQVFNVDHIWTIGFNGTNSQFGVYHRNVDGTASSPCRFYWNDISSTGHSGVIFQGWPNSIASSGGTPPAGAGNEWGFSSYIVAEGNRIEAMGRTATQFGECFYVGTGTSDDGHKSRGDHIWIRFNDLVECTADYCDVKAGSHHVYIYGNIMKEGAFHLGAALHLLYSGNSRPSYYDFDPQIYVLFNRIYDGNITNPVGSSSNYVATSSYAGVRFAFNACWGFSGGGLGFRLRTETTLADGQSSDGELWSIVNNLFWLAQGVVNVGDNTFTPFNSAWIDARNNLGSTSTSGVEASAGTLDFVDSGLIPAVGSVTAADGGDGPGSAFDMSPNSSLVGSGEAVSDLDLFINNYDISQRPVPAATNPGPFQPI